MSEKKPPQSGDKKKTVGYSLRNSRRASSPPHLQTPPAGKKEGRKLGRGDDSCSHSDVDLPVRDSSVGDVASPSTPASNIEIASPSTPASNMENSSASRNTSSPDNTGSTASSKETTNTTDTENLARQDEDQPQSTSETPNEAGPSNPSRTVRANNVPQRILLPPALIAVPNFLQNAAQGGGLILLPQHNNVPSHGHYGWNAAGNIPLFGAPPPPTVTRYDLAPNMMIIIIDFPHQQLVLHTTPEATRLDIFPRYPRNQNSEFQQNANL